MVAQRGSGVTARTTANGVNKPAKSKQPRETKNTTKPANQKLSFKDSHALKTLPARMEEITADIAKRQERLADPDFYSRDPDGFANLSKELDVLASELAAAEERWLELEMRREELEA